MLVCDCIWIVKLYDVGNFFLYIVYDGSFLFVWKIFWWCFRLEVYENCLEYEEY